VQAGERAAELAARYHVPVEDIEELNGLERGAALPAGRAVFIPGARRDAAATQPAARAGSPPTVDPAAGSPPTVAPAGAPPTVATRARGQGGLALRWPVPGGKLGAGFGLRGRRPHEGIDILAPEGTAVLAAAAGTVIYAGSGVRGYGNLILLRHAGGTVTVYAHNRRNQVREQDPVRQGQTIAEVGQTGNATAPHLHFEVRRGESPEDPLLHVHP